VAEGTGCEEGDEDGEQGGGFCGETEGRVESSEAEREWRLDGVSGCTMPNGGLMRSLRASSLSYVV
jgi:hypothetical protein